MVAAWWRWLPSDQVCSLFNISPHTATRARNTNLADNILQRCYVNFWDSDSKRNMDFRALEVVGIGLDSPDTATVNLSEGCKPQLQDTVVVQLE
jgi:hypothetical protein